jgi:hypothetical protein
MRTIVVTDVLAAELVSQKLGEYASGSEHLEAAMPTHVQEALPPVQQIAVNGSRADLPCPQGTPGTVTLSATGHTLSVAEADKGEMFMGYCRRVYQQAQGNRDDVGALVLGTDPWFARFGGFKADGSNWPMAADFFFNTQSGGDSYLTAEEKLANERAKAQWQDTGTRIAHQHDNDAPPAPSSVQGVAAGTSVGEVDVKITDEPTSQQ